MSINRCRGSTTGRESRQLPPRGRLTILASRGGGGMGGSKVFTNTDSDKSTIKNDINQYVDNLRFWYNDNNEFFFFLLFYRSYTGVINNRRVRTREVFRNKRILYTIKYTGDFVFFFFFKAP